MSSVNIKIDSADLFIKAPSGFRSNSLKITAPYLQIEAGSEIVADEIFLCKKKLPKSVIKGTAKARLNNSAPIPFQIPNNVQNVNINQNRQLAIQQNRKLSLEVSYEKYVPNDPKDAWRVVDCSWGHDYNADLTDDFTETIGHLKPVQNINANVNSYNDFINNNSNNQKIDSQTNVNNAPSKNNKSRRTPKNVNYATEALLKEKMKEINANKQSERNYISDISCKFRLKKAFIKDLVKNDILFGQGRIILAFNADQSFSQAQQIALLNLIKGLVDNVPVFVRDIDIKSPVSFSLVRIS